MSDGEIDKPKEQPPAQAEDKAEPSEHDDGARDQNSHSVGHTNADETVGALEEQDPASDGSPGIADSRQLDAIAEASKGDKGAPSTEHTADHLGDRGSDEADNMTSSQTGAEAKRKEIGQSAVQDQSIGVEATAAGPAASLLGGLPEPITGPVSPPNSTTEVNLFLDKDGGCAPKRW